MSASNADKLRKGFFGSSTTLGSAIGSTDTTVPIASTVGLPTDTAIDITIDRVDANGNKTPSARETITVVISGTNGTQAVRGVEGTAQSHAAGAIVEITYTAATHNGMINAILLDHVNGANSGAHNTLHDINGKTWIGQNAVASAVNFLQIANSATGGDLVISAQGTDSNVNIDITPKGSGTIIVPNSSLQTTALKNPYKFSVYKAANQTVTSNTWTKASLDTAIFDTGSNFDLVTNHQFTAPIAGFYQFNGAIIGGSLGGGSFCQVGINVNTFSSVPTYLGVSQDTGVGTSFPISTVSKLIRLSANDTVQLYLFVSGTTAQGGSSQFYLDGFLVSTT